MTGTFDCVSHPEGLPENEKNCLKSDLMELMKWPRYDIAHTHLQHYDDEYDRGDRAAVT